MVFLFNFKSRRNNKKSQYSVVKAETTPHLTKAHHTTPLHTTPLHTTPHHSTPLHSKLDSRNHRDQREILISKTYILYDHKI